MKPPFDIAADLDTPVSAYLKLKPFKPRFLLESVEGGERLARYSFIGFGDCVEVRLDERGLTVNGQHAPRADFATGTAACIARCARACAAAEPANSRCAAARWTGRRRGLRSRAPLRAIAGARARRRALAASSLPRAAIAAGVRSPDARRCAAARGQRERAQLVAQAGRASAARRDSPERQAHPLCAGRRQSEPGRVHPGRSSHEGVHRRRRRVSARAVGALRRRMRAGAVRSLSRAAAAEPVAVHVSTAISATAWSSALRPKRS